MIKEIKVGQFKYEIVDKEKGKFDIKTNNIKDGEQQYIKGVENIKYFKITDIEDMDEYPGNMILALEFTSKDKKRYFYDLSSDRKFLLNPDNKEKVNLLLNLVKKIVKNELDFIDSLYLVYLIGEGNSDIEYAIEYSENFRSLNVVIEPEGNEIEDIDAGELIFRKSYNKENKKYDYFIKVILSYITDKLEYNELPIGKNGIHSSSSDNEFYVPIFKAHNVNNVKEELSKLGYSGEINIKI